MTSQVSVDSQRMSLESQLRDKVRELNEYQAKYDAHSAEMKARYSSRHLLGHSSSAPASVSQFPCTAQSIVWCCIREVLNGQKNILTDSRFLHILMFLFEVAFYFASLRSASVASSSRRTCLICRTDVVVQHWLFSWEYYFRLFWFAPLNSSLANLRLLCVCCAQLDLNAKEFEVSQLKASHETETSKLSTRYPPPVPHCTRTPVALHRFNRTTLTFVQTAPRAHVHF